MCSCGQSLVTLAFLWEKLSQPQFDKDLTRKTAFFEDGRGSSSIIWDWHRYKLEILHQQGKRVKTKSQKANSYVCRSYRGKTGRGSVFASPILNRVKEDWLYFLVSIQQLILLNIWFFRVVFCSRVYSISCNFKFSCHFNEAIRTILVVKFWWLYSTVVICTVFNSMYSLISLAKQSKV